MGVARVSIAMFEGPFALALVAGMAATVNPCGFALLPAYLSAFVGAQDEAHHDPVVRALAVTGALTAGFIAVFGLFGVIVTPLALSINDSLPWVTIVIGIGLVVLGGALLAGCELTLKIPKLQRGGRDGTLLSMFVFGVSYATASLSCTIGPFLAVTTATFRSSNFVSGSLVFVIYGIGMGAIIGILTVAVALAKGTVVQRFRSMLPRINRIAGGLMIVAGLYVAYYGWYEVRLFNGSDGEDPIIDRAVAIQSWLTNFIVPDHPVRVVLVLFGVIAAVLVWRAVRRQRSARRHDDDVTMR
jgi:cytochrome c-type biogenesis protein